jgi:hypothetical protein
MAIVMAELVDTFGHAAAVQGLSGGEFGVFAPRTAIRIVSSACEDASRRSSARCSRCHSGRRVLVRAGFWRSGRRGVDDRSREGGSPPLVRNGRGVRGANPVAQMERPPSSVTNLHIGEGRAGVSPPSPSRSIPTVFSPVSAVASSSE